MKIRLFFAPAMLAILPVVSLAQITVDNSVQFKINNVNSGLVLGIAGQSQVAGANLVQWTDSGAPDHLWHFVPMNNNQYVIENLLTHQVLGVASASKSNGARIVQWADNGTADHLWTVVSAPGGNVMLRNVNSGLNLEIMNADISTNGVVDQWGSTGCTCQEWQLVNTGAAVYPNPGSVSGGGTAVHDPMMLKDSGGTYWLFGTHNTLATSTNRIAFNSEGNALKPLPGWISSWNPGMDVWAPDVVFHDGKYWQYYAVPGSSNNTTHTAAIALATATSPNSNSWQNQGIVIQSNESSTFNAIDPNEIRDTSGNWWMVFGSWWNGIHLIQLDNTTGKQSSSNRTITRLATRSAGIEGAVLYFFNGFYYLFASINPCCSPTSTYRIVVGRSSSITGPYLDRGGVNMLNGGGAILLSTHGNIVGPGGEGVFADSDGPILVYHYYNANSNGAPTLGINRLVFDSSGWPSVR